MQLVKVFQRNRGILYQGPFYSVLQPRSECSTAVKPGKLVQPKEAPYFKNVRLITPQSIDKYLYNSLKLKFSDDYLKSKEPGVELLRNIASNYDYWIVRNHQHLFLYYRVQMMLQRLSFLSSKQITPQQKLREIQKYPPVLILSYSGCTFKSNMVYLKGLLQGQDQNFTHLLYPLTRRLEIDMPELENRVKQVGKELNIKIPAVLKELINIPCFFMDPQILENISHLFIHKYIMPYHYNLDQHTAGVLPPICNLPSLDIPAHYFSNKGSKSLIENLPKYQLNDILDYSYSKANGKGTPECLSSFLISAEFEEYKDRTAGQRLKGRKGFNMPPRQY